MHSKREFTETVFCKGGLMWTVTLVTPRYGNYMHEYSLAKVVSVKTHEICKEMQSTLVVKA